MINLSIDNILSLVKLHPSRVYNIYIFGSHVYGTNNLDSDIDLVIIANTHNPEIEHKIGKYNIHILTIDRFNEGLRNYNIRNIECLMLPNKFILMEKYKFQFNLELHKLRHSISRTCSNSFVKFKKKIIDGEYKIGIKSLYHSIRISMFGEQIAKFGKITDWSCANYIMNDLLSKNWELDDLIEKYTPIKNSHMTNFRLVANKYKK